jgi:hypothetical protein
MAALEKLKRTLGLRVAEAKPWKLPKLNAAGV